MKKIIRIHILLLLLIAIISCEEDKNIPNTEKPVANFEIVTEGALVSGEVIEFNDLSIDPDGFIAAWEWDFGDGKTMSVVDGTSPSHIYEEEGDYMVSLTVADNTGSFSSATSKNITLKKSPASIPPDISWTYYLPGVISHSSPAVADDGTVFMPCDFDDGVRKAEPYPTDFFAIKNGSLVWETRIYEGVDGTGTTDRILSSPSIAANGSLYMNGYYGRNLFNIDASTGTELTKFFTNARHQYSAPVIASDGTVYLGGNSKSGKGVHAIKSSLTEDLWIFEQGNDFFSTPAIGSDGTIYVGSAGTDKVHAINPDGTEKWSYSFGSWTATAIAIGPDETVYFAGETATGGVLIAFSPDGSVKWQNDLPEKINHGGPAVAADGTIYVGGYENRMIAYDPADGSEKWSFTASGAIEVVPAIDNDGNIYFGDLGGYFHILSPDGKKAFKSLQLGDNIQSSAAIGTDGTIYVAANKSGSSILYAIKTNATGLQSGGWPMYANNTKHTGRK